VVIAGKYRGYMDCALYIHSSYGVKRPHIVLRYKPNFMLKVNGSDRVTNVDTGLQLC